MISYYLHHLTLSYIIIPYFQYSGFCIYILSLTKIFLSIMYCYNHKNVNVNISALRRLTTVTGLINFFTHEDPRTPEYSVLMLWEIQTLHYSFTEFDQVWPVQHPQIHNNTRNTQSLWCVLLFLPSVPTIDAVSVSKFYPIHNDHNSPIPGCCCFNKCDQKFCCFCLLHNKQTESLPTGLWSCAGRQHTCTPWNPQPAMFRPTSCSAH